jgi:hypothetical protein
LNLLYTNICSNMLHKQAPYKMFTAQSTDYIKFEVLTRTTFWDVPPCNQIVRKMWLNSIRLHPSRLYCTVRQVNVILHVCSSMIKLFQFLYFRSLQNIPLLPLHNSHWLTYTTCNIHHSCAKQCHATARSKQNKETHTNLYVHVTILWSNYSSAQLQSLSCNQKHNQHRNIGKIWSFAGYEDSHCSICSNGAFSPTFWIDILPPSRIHKQFSLAHRPLLHKDIPLFPQKPQFLFEAYEVCEGLGL